METPPITAYLKTYCGWSAGVRAILQKYNLPYTEKDIIQNPAFRWEMEQRSGQPLSPCVEINGEMLPDVSGDDVERYLARKEPGQLQQRTDRRADRFRLHRRAARRDGRRGRADQLQVRLIILPQPMPVFPRKAFPHREGFFAAFERAPFSHAFMVCHEFVTRTPPCGARVSC